jgi:adenylate cyclase class IV
MEHPYEVERKYRVGRKHFPAIEAKLLDMGFQAVPTKQLDTYLHAAQPSVTRRVRRERGPDGTVYLRTDKCKSKVGRNTNRERETEIAEESYDSAVANEVMSLYGTPLTIKKRRVHFHGKYDGASLTVCLDLKASGGDGIRLGRFVELEIMVPSAEDVPGAHKLLKALGKDVLPECRKRELRGYRTMLIEALARRDKKARKKARKKNR